jgi:hypothetical protein
LLLADSTTSQRSFATRREKRERGRPLRPALEKSPPFLHFVSLSLKLGLLLSGSLFSCRAAGLLLLFCARFCPSIECAFRLLLCAFGKRWPRRKPAQRALLQNLKPWSRRVSRPGCILSRVTRGAQISLHFFSPWGGADLFPKLVRLARGYFHPPGLVCDRSL